MADTKVKRILAGEVVPHPGDPGGDGGTARARAKVDLRKAGIAINAWLSHCEQAEQKRSGNLVQQAIC